MNFRSIFVLFTLFFLIPISSGAVETKRCRTINYKENHIYEIKSVMYRGTHISLPENVSAEPGIANELWEVTALGNDVFVQPTSSENQGKSAHLTIFGENHKYHFRLTRVSNNFDQCVVLKLKKPMFQKSQGFVRSSALTQQNHMLGQKIDGLRRQVKTLKNQHHENVGDALTKYRALIYTRYKWSNSGYKVVTDVFDDGRFTFIRLREDNHGHPVITAKIDGNTEMIEYQNETSNIYKIVGIFPKLTLKYGASKIVIRRKDKFSNGSY